MAAISPRALYGIDAQMDDGLPGSGQVRGNAAAACYTVAANAVYALTDNVGCIAYFQGDN